MLKKIIASILVILLVSQVFPMNVFAEEITSEEYSEEYTDEYADETIVDNTETLEDVYIISEDTSKRDETTKHFFMSDGSYNAISYSLPVHYREDGTEEWAEIDNTLVEVEDENDTTFLKPASSPIDVKFAKNSDADNLVSYKVNEYDISWSYENRKNGLFNNTAKISKKTNKQTHSDTKKIPVDNLNNLNSKAKYNRLYNNVDVEYTVTSEGVKENIILNKKSAQNEFQIKYNIGKLTAVQTNERLITLYDGENAVVHIDAPYMIDSANVQSDALTFKIIEQKNGILRVRLTADSKWLQSDDREYPVTIDPYIFEVNQDISNDATYISKNISSSSYPHGSLVVGNCSAYGVTRAYLKFSLPTLSAGDMVIGGTLGLYQFSGSGGYSTATGASSIRINVARVTGSWNAQGVIYSSSTPSYNSTIIDSITVSSVSSMTLRTIDIGKLVKGWYNEEYDNYGIRLYSSNESDSTYAIFAATDYDSGSRAPIMVVSYINNKGLEDRWTYHSQSLGESGTSYINDCTGNLVFVSPVAHTVGNNAPISVNLVYNGYLVNSSGTGIGKCGPGWRFDFQQQITPIASGTALYTSGFRYIYTDADGTDHYFKAKGSSTSQFEDEEGLGFTLTVGSDGDSKYTLEFKSGNKNVYNTNGAIVKICDTDNNYYKFTYSNNKVSYITDGANRKISFTYTSAGYFSTITDAANRVTTISYASPAKISKITYPDGTSTKFEYDNNSRLIKCIGIDGTALKYEYPTSSYNTVKNRVTKVSQLATDGTVGDYLNINYSYNNYTVFTDKEERSETYLFDSCGRTVCVNDADGGGARYKYNTTTGTDASKKNNKLLSATAKTKYVNNLLKNHSFESGQTNWSKDGSGGTSSAVTGNSYLGEKAFAITKNATGNLKWYQRVNVNTTNFKAGGTYTFSAYVKTTAENTKTSIYANCFDTSTGSNVSLACPASQKVNELVSEYKRIYVTFTIPADTDFVNFVLSAQGTSGTTYFDCIQVEEGDVVNDYNLLENSSFDDTSSSVWVGNALTSADGYNNSRYKIVGDPTKDKHIHQTVIINKPASECAFSLSGYAQANSLPLPSGSNRYYSLNAVLVFDSGDNQYINFTFEPSISGNQYNTAIIKASDANSGKILKSMRIRMVYYKNANTAYFDNISLNIDKTGTSYTHDGNGNVISAVDNAKNTQTFSYDNANNLIESNYQDNTSYEYTYDENGSNKHRLLSAKSVNSNINISYEYNDKGFVKKTTVTGGNKSIVTETGYGGTNSNFVTSEKDSLGNTTTYTYDQTKGTLSNVKDSAGTVTNYTYNENNDYLTGLFVTGTASSLVNYNYDATTRVLKGITTNTCVYNFAYDKFMNVSSVSVGTQPLTTNTYAANNGNLTKSTYGNGSYVAYNYDNLDRVIYQCYNNSQENIMNVYSWTYNGNNQVASYVDVPDGKVYNYTYDLSGRLTEMNRNDGAYIRTSYDTKNLSTGIDYSFGGTTEKITYTYNESKDNAPANASFNNSSSSAIAYDALGRKSMDALHSGYSFFLKTTYSYLDNASDSSKTSGLVSKIDYDLSSIEDLEYTYDVNGNITGIREGGILLESYTYDKLNRLTRVDSLTQAKTIQYEYDKSGNITSKKEYPYNNTTNPTSTILYTYGDSNWKDKLTAYNGKIIDYDAIGNPLSYDGKTFTWLGRRLNTYKSGSTTTSYTYNSDGIRTSKTVGNTTTEYFLSGSQILAQKTGSTTMPFYYDANGTRIAFKYNGTMYYYVYNLQGDVTHIIDSTGAIKGTYQYDAWGKILNLSSLTAIAQANPFRYRGYYYDTESGLYYLNSRYYNAEWGRFINADGYIYTGQGITGYNMFAYCGNNPVNCYDPNGEAFLTATICGIAVWKIAAAFIGTLFVGAATYAVTDSLVKNPPVLPSISLPKIDVKPKSDSKEKDVAPTLPKTPAKDPVHHIVAKADPRAAESRQILINVGIDPWTDPRNLVVLPQSYHASLHTTAYHNYITERLRPVAGDKAGVEATLASLKAEILARSALGIRWD